MIQRLIANRTAQIGAALVVLYFLLYPEPGSPLPRSLSSRSCGR